MTFKLIFFIKSFQITSNIFSLLIKDCLKININRVKKNIFQAKVNLKVFEFYNVSTFAAYGAFHIHPSEQLAHHVFPALQSYLF